MGTNMRFFDAGSFQHDIAVIQTSARGGGRRRQIAPWVWLIKLHGSLGWYESEEAGIRRTAFASPVPPGARRLMFPPQFRKATETVYPPYSTIWTEFRNRLTLGPNPLNRLVAIGYGMADEHVNDVLEAALARSNMTLIIISKLLANDVFDRWADRENTVIVTGDRCSLKGEVGQGHPSLWSFEAVVEELRR